MDPDCFLFLPGFFAGTSLAQEVMDEASRLTQTYETTLYGKTVVPRRRSCLVGGVGTSWEGYSLLPAVTWDSCPGVLRVKKEVEKASGVTFDYCLMHLYPDGDASIAWHRDKEALRTPVASASFGASRLFRFREVGQTKGWIKEFTLDSGCLGVMFPPCQTKYEHCVPVQSRVRSPRVNLTFRMKE